MHDPVDSRAATGTTAVSERASVVLERQRQRHQPEEVDADDEGVGALVNNTGLDGDAATG